VLDEVQADGLRIGYQRLGDGPAVVFLQAFFGDHRVWRGQRELARDHTLVAWDVPGCGRSTLPPEGFRMPEYASVLADFIARLGLERPHLFNHLEQLAELVDQTREPGQRVQAVLEAYALIQHQRGAAEVATFLHRDEHVAWAQRRLHDLVRGLLTDAAQAGDVRGDVTPEGLASYCLHALAAAGSLPSEAAVRRLVAVTLSGLRAPR
jgi:hypothetical protein